MTLSSWRDDRLPDVLWAAILTATLSRDEYLHVFSQVAGRAQHLGGQKVKGIEHTLLAELDPETFDTLMDPVFATAKMRDSVAVLLCFEGLPDHAHWQRNLKAPRGEPDITLLAQAVASCTDHQSASSTDCRWLRQIAKVVIGQIGFNRGMEERVRQLFDYPKLADKELLGGFIRSGEVAGLPESIESLWPKTFWEECWRKTKCMPAYRYLADHVATDYLVEQISRIYGARFLGAFLRFRKIRGWTPA